ncbi:hypothetical protein PCASD_11741 [Puccinia coronata f. sp. avenae]|uniref:Uncharacterized protein n=2 Tax=Puccinia coronata f. sp. avenae TaxID=200324 RepID=A0A2N5UQM3_9BASI|nr:hypothetical protein PCASD_11741 [Puccinia coronata f. sp. avenae]
MPTRSWQSSIKNTNELWLSSQIDTRKEFEKKAQEFGLKDHIAWKLMELKRDHLEDRTRIIKLEKDAPDRLYNPFIHLKSFDGSQDAPVEYLHVYLLGVVKYLWGDFMSNVKDNQLGELEARWASFNTEGLRISPVQA